MTKGQNGRWSWGLGCGEKGDGRAFILVTVGQQADFQPRNDVISFIFWSPVWRMDLREKDRTEGGDLV